MQRRGLVLSMLMQLKQICNHPVQYLHQAGKEAEIDWLNGRAQRQAGAAGRTAGRNPGRVATGR